jgi:c-di-GMP-binding flagellar brake protein YcgR
MPFNKKNQENRRKHARISLCRLVKIQLSKTSSQSEISQLYDVSESGMRFHVTDLSKTGFKMSSPGMEPGSASAQNLLSVKKGDTLFFRMRIDPEHDDVAVLGILAWVTRSKSVGGAIRLKAGVQFVDISDKDRKLIQVYVSAFQD